MKRKLIKIMYVVTPVMLVLLLALNVFTILKVKALEESAGGDKTEDVAQENDVTIGGEYVIKATTQISDAYKSGNTSNLSDKDKETLNMAKSVLDEIITDGMSDYEKELAVYKWMTANIGFDSGSMTVVPDDDSKPVDNPNGVLKNHEAVCVGYATTFRLFMQMLGIDCMVVHDSYLSHSWDLVKLDGQWYHTDVYSDAGSSTGNFSHFNLNDETMMNSQEWNTDFFPAADGYKYNYAYVNKTQCSDVYAIPELVRAALDARQGVVSLDFGKDVSDDIYDLADTIMNSVENTVVFNAGYGVSFSWSWLDAGDDNVFCVYISYEKSEDPDVDPGVADETQQKIDDAVNKAFGDLGGGDFTANDHETIIGGTSSVARIA